MWAVSMTDEETGRWLLAISKHLRMYARDARLTYLYATERSAKDGELLLRLRGLGSISKKKFDALSLEPVC